MHENTFSLRSRQITVCVRNESTHAKLSAQWKQTSSQIGHVNRFCCVLGHIVYLCHFVTDAMDLNLQTWNPKTLLCFQNFFKDLLLTVFWETHLQNKIITYKSGLMLPIKGSSVVEMLRFLMWFDFGMLLDLKLEYFIWSRCIYFVIILWIAVELISIRLVTTQDSTYPLLIWMGGF